MLERRFKVEVKKQIVIDALNKQVPLGDIYGIFFEDLNHAADGGLYAELIQNRSFEFDSIDNKNYHSLTAWEKVERAGAKVNVWVESSNPLNVKNKNYLGIEVLETGDGAGFLNHGFNTGIALHENELYDFSCYARTKDKQPMEIEINLMNEAGICYSTECIVIEGTEWKQYHSTFTAAGTDYSTRLVILIKNPGVLYFDMISLFPRNTYKGRKNGLRADIAKKLEELKPRFMRFPGGCLVHDGSLNSEDRNSMYRWKNTIGNVEERPARRNNWGYNQTLGLGYYEYFLLCEDIGAKAIPVIPGGYDPHHQRIVPIEELGPWIGDALDLIEFANGDVNTTWGKKRAELGHPEPFHLEYIGVGNEEVGEPFFERYPYFHKAIKDKYPDIKVINSSGPFAAGSEYDRGWNSAREHKSDLVDEHYYQSPEWFLANYHRYDDFKADEPKVFLGEYASWGNTYYNALVEAAFMTGLEKNAHAVGLACYAPMLCNTDYINWQPDMIWFNNHEIFATPNYYVQKLFMNHQGEYLLNTTANGLTKAVKSEAKALNGKISLFSKGIKSAYKNIRFKDMVTGEEQFAEDIDLEIDEIRELFQTGSSHYRLTLKGIRKSGNRGLEIFFGESDKKNRLIWEVGGWQNQDCMVSSTVQGRTSCLTQSIFSMELDREYDLVLEVKERIIRTFVDGILMNVTEDKLPVIEELYYTASSQGENEIIAKFVNVNSDELITDITLSGLEDKKLLCKVYELSGYLPDDVNSFENPAKVAPSEKSIDVGSHFQYTFPKESVTVMRFKFD